MRYCSYGVATWLWHIAITTTNPNKIYSHSCHWQPASRLCSMLYQLTLTFSLLPLLPHSTSHPSVRQTNTTSHWLSSLELNIVFMSPLHSSALLGVGKKETCENEWASNNNKVTPCRDIICKHSSSNKMMPFNLAIPGQHTGWTSFQGLTTPPPQTLICIFHKGGNFATTGYLSKIKEISEHKCYITVNIMNYLIDMNIWVVTFTYLNWFKQSPAWNSCGNKKTRQINQYTFISAREIRYSSLISTIAAFIGCQIDWKLFLYPKNCTGPVSVCMKWIWFLFIKWRWDMYMCIHLLYVCVLFRVTEMLVCLLCGYAFCLPQWLFGPEALQWIGAEIRQNLRHFPSQLFPPLLPHSFLELQIWKLPPGQEASPQHPSEV